MGAEQASGRAAPFPEHVIVVSGKSERTALGRLAEVFS